MSSLEVLYLNDNFLSGIMPTNIENLCSLQDLYLDSNNINDNILTRLPECSWSKLCHRDLHGANLTGYLPFWMGNMTNLGYLDISQNMLVGIIPFEIHNMTSLGYLDMSQNILFGGLHLG
jgi:Leucine-rich repeat (LRR) protein